MVWGVNFDDNFQKYSALQFQLELLAASAHQAFEPQISTRGYATGTKINPDFETVMAGLGSRVPFCQHYHVKKLTEKTTQKALSTF